MKTTSIVLDSSFSDQKYTTAVWSEGYIGLPIQFPESSTQHGFSYFTKDETVYYHDLAVDGNRSYVLHSKESESNENYEVAILETNSAGEIELKGEYKPNTNIDDHKLSFLMKVTAKDNLLYVIYATNNHDNNGKFFIDVVDVIDPSRPEVVTSHQFGGLGGSYQMQYVKDVVIADNILHIENIIKERPVNDSSQQLYQITHLDISNPLQSKPAGATLFANPEAVLDIAYKDHYTYILNSVNTHSSILSIYSGTDFVDEVALDNAVEIKVVGNRLYTKNINRETGVPYFESYDVALPGSLILVGRVAVLSNNLFMSEKYVNPYVEGYGLSTLPSLENHIAFYEDIVYAYDGEFIYEIDTSKEKESGNVIDKTMADIDKMIVTPSALYTLNYTTGVAVRVTIDDGFLFKSHTIFASSSVSQSEYIGTVNEFSLMIFSNDEGCTHLAVYEADQSSHVNTVDFNGNYCGDAYLSTGNEYLIVQTLNQPQETVVYSLDKLPLIEEVYRSEQKDEFTISNGLGYFINNPYSESSLSVINFSNENIGSVVSDKILVDLSGPELIIDDSLVYAYSTDALSSWDVHESRLKVFDASTPQNIISLGQSTIPRSAKYASNFVLIDTNAFVLDKSNHVYSYDFSDLNSVPLTGKVSLPKLNSYPYDEHALIKIDNNHLLAWGRDSIVFIDASDPTNMRTVASIDSYYQDFSRDVDWMTDSVIVSDYDFDTQKTTYLQYVLPVALNDNVIQSIQINHTKNERVKHATIHTIDHNPGGTDIRYYLSNDGGVTWNLVENGMEFSFEGEGSDLRVRAELLSSDQFLHPKIFSLEVTYR